mmetsp:Transcript_72516/g.156829  ORF Transcript_72516/g.156829 Transcript_72516/m.156829 type:complete len:472 (+) Transcript_72516:1218-2633(+)
MRLPPLRAHRAQLARLARLEQQDRVERNRLDHGAQTRLPGRAVLQPEQGVRQQRRNQQVVDLPAPGQTGRVLGLGRQGGQPLGHGGHLDLGQGHPGVQLRLDQGAQGRSRPDGPRQGRRDPPADRAVLARDALQQTQLRSLHEEPPDRRQVQLAEDARLDRRHRHLLPARRQGGQGAERVRNLREDRGAAARTHRHRRTLQQVRNQRQGDAPGADLPLEGGAALQCDSRVRARERGAHQAGLGRRVHLGRGGGAQRHRAHGGAQGVEGLLEQQSPAGLGQGSARQGGVRARSPGRHAEPEELGALGLHQPQEVPVRRHPPDAQYVGGQEDHGRGRVDLRGAQHDARAPRGPAAGRLLDPRVQARGRQLRHRRGLDRRHRPEGRHLQPLPHRQHPVHRKGRRETQKRRQEAEPPLLRVPLLPLPHQGRQPNQQRKQQNVHAATQVQAGRQTQRQGSQHVENEGSLSPHGHLS